MGNYLKSVQELVHLNIVITKRGVYFLHVWRRGGLAHFSFYFVSLVE